MLTTIFYCLIALVIFWAGRDLFRSWRDREFGPDDKDLYEPDSPKPEDYL